MGFKVKFLLLGAALILVLYLQFCADFRSMMAPPVVEESEDVTLPPGEETGETMPPEEGAVP